MLSGNKDTDMDEHLYALARAIEVRSAGKTHADKPGKRKVSHQCVSARGSVSSSFGRTISDNTHM